MNKTYQSIWNAALGTFVAAPETARACGKKSAGGKVASAANGTVISNVAPGVAGTDAVNVNQLNGVNNRVNALGDQVNRVTD